MSNNTNLDEMRAALHTIASALEEENPEQASPEAALSESPPQKGALSRPVISLPAFARFEDRKQKKAGGNIIKFLAGLLALTLIARGTSGATLARVELTRPTRSEIVEAVTGKATVSARDTNGVFAPEGLTIKELHVGPGQSVSAGDAVAAFDPAEISDKLDRAAAFFEKLLLDLEKLEREESTDSSQVESARRNLSRARDDLNATRIKDEADIAAARETLAEVLDKQVDDPDVTALESAMRNLNRILEDYEAVERQGKSDVDNARALLNETLGKRAQTVDSSAVDTAYRNLSRAEEDYDITRVQGERAVSAALAALETARSDGADEAVIVLRESALETARNTHRDNLRTASRRIEDAQAAYSKAEQDYSNSTSQAASSRQTEIDNARNALEAAMKKAEDNLLSALRRVEDAEFSMANAERDFDRTANQASTARQNELTNARNALESALKKAEDNLQSAARRVEDAEVSLRNAERDYDRNSRQSTDNAISNSVSAVSLRLDIDDQKAVLDALRLLDLSGGVLYADISGVVSTTRSEGSVTGKDAVLVFRDDSKGYEAHAQLSKSDADKLAVGVDCSVTTGGGSMYYNPTVTGTISAITPPDEQDRVRVTVRLPDGGWSEGQLVDIQAVQNRSTYDTCIPLSGLRSDNSGYYVFLVERQSTILGVENIVVRTPVTVLASDDDMAAVRGAVSGSTEVITGSNKAVQTGDRVRMSG